MNFEVKLILYIRLFFFSSLFFLHQSPQVFLMASFSLSFFILFPFIYLSIFYTFFFLPLIYFHSFLYIILSSSFVHIFPFFIIHYIFSLNFFFSFPLLLFNLLHFFPFVLPSFPSSLSFFFSLYSSTFTPPLSSTTSLFPYLSPLISSSIFRFTSFLLFYLSPFFVLFSLLFFFFFYFFVISSLFPPFFLT